jgi:hypothetical protein
MVFGTLAPEFVAAIAYTQRRNAQGLLQDYRDHHKAFYFPMPQIAGTEIEQKCAKCALESFRSKPVEQWTLTHSFYCLMGGFVICPPGSDKPFPVNGKQLLWLLKYGYVEVPSMSLEEIEDKSKADSLLKSIAVLQAMWFLIQCVGRYAQKLPTTTLEITTLAYVLCMIPCQLLWWSKPYNVSVGTSLRILAWPRGTREKLQELSLDKGYSFYIKRNLIEFPRMLNFIEMDEDWIVGWCNAPNWVAAILTAIAFGGTHCIAWDFHYPTAAEALLWRISSLLIVCIGPLGVLGYWMRKCGYMRGKSLRYSLIFFNWLYLVVRTYLLAEIFIAFRSMPTGVYDTVDWSQYVLNLA